MISYSYSSFETASLPAVAPSPLSLPSRNPRMPVPRRFLCLSLLLLIAILYFWSGDSLYHALSTSKTLFSSWTAPTHSPSPTVTSTTPSATPVPQPSPSDLSRTLVVARLQEEDVSWIQQGLPDLQTAIYVVDNPLAEHPVPQNKGHEAMVYLTYIIDHYDTLPDVSIFTHAERITWHNNDLLDSDLVKMIGRLNSARVVREGYFPLRCHIQPGCSDNLHLNRADENLHKPEETVIKQVWSELHPNNPLPATLSAPCCAQFAASRQAILTFPLSQYSAWRDWLLQTDLSDGVSGRIWEYTWHYIFSGRADFCPDPHQCYCDGYGVCFESKAASDAWFALDTSRKELEDEYREWQETNRNDVQARTYEDRIEDMKSELERLKVEAIARGDDSARRKEALELLE